MSIQRRLIWPLFDEDKVPGVFLIDEQVVSDAIRFQSSLLDQFGVLRANGFKVFGFDEILSDDFQHGVLSWFKANLPMRLAFKRCLRGSQLIRLKAVRPRHLPHPRVKLAIHFTGQQLSRLQEHMQLREQFDLGCRHAPYQMFG